MLEDEEKRLERPLTQEERAKVIEDFFKKKPE